MNALRSCPAFLAARSILRSNATGTQISLLVIPVFRFISPLRIYTLYPQVKRAASPAQMSQSKPLGIHSGIHYPAGRRRQSTGGLAAYSHPFLIFGFLNVLRQTITGDDVRGFHTPPVKPFGNYDLRIHLLFTEKSTTY